MKRSIYILMAVILLSAVNAFPPDDVGYFVFQARNATDGSFYDGTFTVTERIYDAKVVGNLLKTQTVDYTINNGTWAGQINDTGIDYSAQFWIELDVETDTLEPRILYIPSIQTQTALNVTELNFNSITYTGLLGVENLTPGLNSQVLKTVGGVPTWDTDSTGSNNFVTAITVTGTTTKNITLTRSGLADISDTFIDLQGGNTTQDIRDAINNTNGIYNINVSAVTLALEDRSISSWDAVNGSATDTNESTRFNALVANNCAGTDKMIGVNNSGGVNCSSDLNTQLSQQQVRDFVNNTGIYNIDINASSIAIDDQTITSWDAVNGSASDTNCNASGSCSAGGVVYNDTGTYNLIVNGTFTSLDWSNVSVTESQIIDLQNYVTADVNDTLEAYYLYPNGTNPPTGNHLVNKEYVDSSVGGLNFDFFLTNDSSDILGYFNMTEIDLDEPESSIQSASFGAGAAQNIVNFSTQDGFPEFNQLVAGIFDGHIHASVSGTKPTIIYWELHKRNASGEFLLITSETSPVLTAVETNYNLHGSLLEDVNLESGNRLVMKWFADVDVTGSDVVITLTMEGELNSRLTVRTESQAFNDVFVRRNDWTTHDDYPAACPTDEAVIQIDDTNVCQAFATSDTNESTRFNALVADDCAGNDKMVGVNTTGGVNCEADLNTQLSQQQVRDFVNDTNGIYNMNVSAVTLALEDRTITSWNAVNASAVDTNCNATASCSAGGVVYNNTDGTYNLNLTNILQTLVDVSITQRAFIFSGTINNALTLNSTDNRVGIIFFDDGTQEVNIGSDDNDFYVNVGAADRLVIDNDTGYVGIGTSVPNEILHVLSANAQIEIESSGDQWTTLRTLNSGGVDVRLDASPSATGQGQIGTFSDHPFVINSNNAERVRVNQSGIDVTGAVFVNGTLLENTFNSTEDVISAANNTGLNLVYNDNVNITANATCFIGNGATSTLAIC